MTKYLPFYYDTKGYFQNDKSFLITGVHMAFLTAFLNSSIFKFCFIDNFPELQGGTRELRKVFFDKIRVIKVSEDVNRSFIAMLDEMQLTPSKELAVKIDNEIFNLYDLTPEERDYIGFIEIQ